MFKVNNQPDLFSFESQLLDSKQKELLEKTPEKVFYNLIFSNNGSRPNVAVNILISALNLKERKSWSYDELTASIMFGISINFGRIYRLLMSKDENFADILIKFNTFVSQIVFFLNLSQNTARINRESN